MTSEEDKKKYTELKAKMGELLSKLSDLQDEVLDTYKTICELADAEEDAGSSSIDDISFFDEDDESFSEIIEVEKEDDFDEADTQELDFKTLSEELDKLFENED